ncbi:hypothetical protein D3C87_1948970 [compost metagenome]
MAGLQLAHGWRQKALLSLLRKRRFRHQTRMNSFAVRNTVFNCFNNQVRVRVDSVIVVFRVAGDFLAAIIERVCCLAELHAIVLTRNRRRFFA